MLRNNKKSVDHLEETIGRHLVIKGDSGDSPEEVRSTVEKVPVILQGVQHHKQNVRRDRNIKAVSDESSEGNEEHSIGNKRATLVTQWQNHG